MDLHPAAANSRSALRAGRVRRVVVEELASFYPLVFVSGVIGGLLPRYVANRLRGQIMKAAGWKIGPRSLFADVPRFGGSGPITRRLTIASLVAAKLA